MPLPDSVLLQIADSAFPTGAFAYSNGLEALARAGRFPDVAALEGYASVYLRQAEGFDLAFVAAAHGADDAETFASVCAEWDAYFWNHPVRQASLRQSRVLLDLLREVFPAPGLEVLKASPGTLHFAPALGRALALLGASRAQACWVYLHGLARDQMAAAVRLGLIGPRFAQALQARLAAGARARLGDGSALPSIENAWRTAPLAETGQGAHGFLYSRLFQN